MVDIVTRLGKGSPLTNAEVDANFTNLAEVSGVTGEPMGHEDRTTSTISFNASTRTFTIAPVASSFTVWCKGKKVVVSTAQTVTIPNTTGMYSIYYDANGVLSAKSGYFTFSLEAPTAYVYWNAATGTAPYFGDERHGVVLDWQTHEYLHRTRGAALASGFSASGYVLGGNGSSNSHAQITLEGGTFFDEDMKIIVTATNTPTAGTWEQDLLSPARIPVLYLSGTGWVIDAPTDYPLKQGTARPQYNAYSGGVWSTADVANNKYATSWILATNNLTYPVIAIIGQAENDLQSAAEAVDFTALQLPGFPSVEFRPLYKLIFQCADSCTNAVHASLVSITDIRSIAAAGTAASIVTDHGNLSGLSDDDHPQYIHVDTLRTVSAAVKASFLPSQTSNAGKFLQTDGTATSWQALTSGNVTTALGFTPYNATNPSGYISGITSGMVTTALGFTPYNATNPSGYVTAAGARGAISVTGAGSYDSATGVINIVGGVTSFNTRTGAITLSSADVTTALGFTPYNNTNPSGYITGITSTMVTTALGFTPYNSSNPNGYISSITSANVTTALGFTPYNATNPSGYITSSALSGYLTSASAASTYLPLSGGTLTGKLKISLAGGTTPSNFFEINNTAAAVGNKAGIQLNTGPAWSTTFFTEQGTWWHAFGSDVGTYHWGYDGTNLKIGTNIVLHAGNVSTYAHTISSDPSTSGPGALAIGNNGSYSFVQSHAGQPLRLNPVGNPVQVGSNTVLHAGNYNSYALPLTGGTLTGSLTISAGASTQLTVRGTEADIWLNSTGPDATWRILGSTGGNTHRFRIYDHTNSAERFFINANGNVSAQIDFRAPIFYDSNDTTYYVDPNSTSIMKGIDVRVGSVIQFYTAAGSLRGYINATDTDDNHFQIATSGGEDIVFKDAGLSGTRNFVIRGSNAGSEAYGSMRSPIFYDSNNTGYYGDPAGTSQLNLGRFQIPVYGGGSGVYNDDRMTLSVGSSGLGSIVYQSQYNSPSYPDYGMVFIHGASGGNRNVWSISPDGPAKGDSLNFLYDLNSTNIHVGTTRFRLDGSGNTFSQSSSRAPIFYDSQDTGFYVDPTGASRILQLYVDGAHQSGYGIIKVVSDNDALISLYTENNATSGMRMQSASGGTDVLFVGKRSGTDSEFAVDFGFTQTAEEFLVTSSGDTYARTSSRAPIFYDRDDTGYYANPNSTSRFNVLEVGTGPGGTNAGNLYIKGNNSFRWIAGYAPDYGVGNGFGLYSDSLGAYYASLSTSGNWYFGVNDHSSSYRVSINGTGYATSDLRAPIFYDSSNTTYYIDPNGMSSVYGVAIRGDQSSTDSSNQIFFWSSGNTTTSAIGFKANGGYFTNPTGNGDGYNTYLTMDSAGRGWVFRRGVGGSDFGAAYTSGWILNNGIWQANASMRAPIFYDSDDTGYFVNPAQGGFSLRGGTSDRVTFFTNDSGFKVTNAEGNSVADVRLGAAWGAPGVYSSTSFYVMSENSVYWKIGNADKGYIDSSAHLHAFGSMRSPIFYDRDNTGYYADFANTDVSINVNGSIVLNNGGGSNTDGLKFTGANSRIWFQGRRAVEGDSAGNNFQLGEGFTFTTIYNQTRSPIFYDSNDTAYYGNFASTSRINAITFDQLTSTAYNTPNQLVTSSDTNWTYGCHYDGGSTYYMQVKFYGTGDDTRGFRVLNTNGSTVVWRVNGAGNSIASGNVTAYSDERLKTNWRGMPENFVSRLAQVKVGIYDRIDGSKLTQVGVGAQSFQKLLPQAVDKADDEMGTLSVSYGNAALASAVELAKDNVELRARIERLESLINKLIGD